MSKNVFVRICNSPPPRLDRVFEYVMENDPAHVLICQYWACALGLFLLIEFSMFSGGKNRKSFANLKSTQFANVLLECRFPCFADSLLVVASAVVSIPKILRRKLFHGLALTLFIPVFIIFGAQVQCQCVSFYVPNYLLSYFRFFIEEKYAKAKLWSCTWVSSSHGIR